MTCASSCFIRCHSRFVLIPALLISFVLIGCGGTQPTGSSTEPTIAITGVPASVTAGSSTTLTVTAANATTVAVTGTDGSSYTLSATGGSQTVSPSTSATYTATASGPGGKASATASVTVTANPAPTVTISANPPTIVAGTSSTLTVAATNATGVTMTGSDGSTYTLEATGGTQTVTPPVTTTYQVTATGAGGKASASATVTVTANPAPTVTISASPAAVMAGISSTLTVSATNATALTVTGTDGSSYTLQAAGGSQIVTPSASTTYTAKATGSGGNATATATVSVTYPAPAVSIAASPASIISGKPSTLTVTAVNATQVSVSGSDGSIYPMATSGGTQAVTPTATTVYTASATGAGGTATVSTAVTVTANPAPTLTIVANPPSIFTGGSSTLTVTAAYATQVTVTGTDGSSYSLQATGGTQPVSPAASTTYTAAATGTGGNASKTATVTVNAAGTVQSIDHVIFMLQENHTFDNYFGMLNPYRKANDLNIGDDGKEYDVDGIDDKLTTISNSDDEGTSYPLFKFTSTCSDDNSSDWLASFGDVNRYDFLTTRPIKMDGFVHNAEGYAKSCGINGVAGSCSGVFSDQLGQRAMGYYDQGFLNYYYYMASQFAVSDRWFSPVASKSIDNRIATFTGGTTQGLVKDPGGDDHLGGQLAIETIFKELDENGVSWKIYYTVTQGFCLNDDDCVAGPSAWYPATDFSNLTYSYKFLYGNPSGASCAPLQPSSVVGDPTSSFCIDSTHIAPIATYYTDLTNGTLPQFSFIEPGYANNDEHPGSGQSILQGQAEVAKVVNAFMLSSAWNDSVFFLAYDEGGGPYDHVPPVPGHSNDYTDTSLGTIPDIASIDVNPDISSVNPPNPIYLPCVPTGGTPTVHCDLSANEPGANPADAAAEYGFAAQIGFRVPNLIVSSFTRRHYVSHTPMDHTAILKFVESRFINSAAHLTARDAAQPNLLEFFDFNNIPWATPPIPPSPVTTETLGYNPCNAGSFAPALSRKQK